MYILLVLVLLATACTVEDDTNDLTIEFEEQTPEVENPPLPVAPTCDDYIQNQGETNVDCGGPCQPCYVPPTENLYVINGNFEEEGIPAELEDPYKVGYTISKYYRDDLEGEASIRLIVSKAIEGATERPAISLQLSAPVKTGNMYKVSMIYDEIKGSFHPLKIGFGEGKYESYNEEQITKELTRITFSLTADTDSDKLYIYFDGTKTKTFKFDDVKIEALN